jgi:hypothetical protein
MAVLDLVEGRIAKLVPSMRIERSKLMNAIAAMRSSSQHFVVEHGENTLIAQTDDLPFSTKKQSVLLVWIGDGEGVRLFRQWMGWVRSRPVIRVACVTPLFDHPRLDSFLRREGFTRHGGMYVWERV